MSLPCYYALMLSLCSGFWIYRRILVFPNAVSLSWHCKRLVPISLPKAEIRRIWKFLHVKKKNNSIKKRIFRNRTKNCNCKSCTNNIKLLVRKSQQLAIPAWNACKQTEVINDFLHVSTSDPSGSLNFKNTAQFKSEFPCFPWKRLYIPLLFFFFFLKQCPPIP